MLLLQYNSQVHDELDKKVTTEHIFGINRSDIRTSIKNTKYKYKLKHFVFFNVFDKYGLHYLINCKIYVPKLKCDQEISLVTILTDMSTYRLTESLTRLDNLISNFDNSENTHSKKQIRIYLDRIRILVSNELTRKQKYMITPTKHSQIKRVISM